MLRPPTDKISAETREKLLALAEFIERDQEHGFYMGLVWSGADDPDWDYGVHRSDKPECGTAGCIAGHWEFMHGNAKKPSCHAEEQIGLTYDQARSLFFPREWINCNDRSKAVRVVRHLAYTGEVDWSV